MYYNNFIEINHHNLFMNESGIEVQRGFFLLLRNSFPFFFYYARY